MKKILNTILSTLFLTLLMTVFTLLASCSEEVDPPINEAPIVADPLTDLNEQEGFGTKTVSLSGVFSDTEGDEITFTATSSSEGVVTVAVSGITLTLTEVGAGTSKITVTASDGNGGTASDDFNLSVNAAANNAPTVLSAIADLTLDAGFATKTVSLAGVFKDQDNDALTYTASSSSQGVVTTAISGTTLTLTEVGTGTSTITVIANDGNGGTVSDDFRVFVNAATNNAPTVANPLADVTVDASFATKAVDLSGVFADKDNDPLTFSASSSDRDVVKVNVSSTTLNINEQGTGSATITVTADDGKGGTVQDEFTISVNSSNGSGGTVTITFGSSTGNSIEVTSWTEASNVAGYVVVISDDNTITNLTNGDDTQAGSTYVGYGDQRIYSGTSISKVTVTLLEDVKTYYFKVFPYTGDFIFDTNQSVQEGTTTNCSTSSTTVNEVCFEVGTSSRTISSNQYPSHAVGRFPNASPTAIQVTRVLTLSPSKANSTTYVYDETGGPTPQNKNFYQFGIATNGVEFHPMGLKPWSNPNTGEQNWKWQEQVTLEGQTDLDAYGAHVTSQGNYHYHGDIVALAVGEDGSKHSLLYGFAGDGFPIYYKYGYVTATDPSSGIKELKSSYRLKSGTRTGTGTSGSDYPSGSYDGTYIQDYEYVTGLGDLDECNGRTGKTPEYPEGTYYYLITTDFPITPNCFYGTPDSDWVIGQ